MSLSEIPELADRAIENGYGDEVGNLHDDYVEGLITLAEVIEKLRQLS